MDRACSKNGGKMKAYRLLVGKQEGNKNNGVFWDVTPCGSS
jgi:hypothetical protein